MASQEQSQGDCQLMSNQERVDVWTLELQKHSEEAVEREVRWLSELIEEEKP